MGGLISILMTVYNREKYIAEAIESVLNSTYQNFELIIVDDCSTDKSVEIAKAYALKDKRLQVYINEHNLGDYPNRNQAASYAKGEYIKYLDSDDLIYPNSLEYMLSLFEEEYPNTDFLLPYNGKKRHTPFEVSGLKALKQHFIGTKEEGTYFFSGPSGHMYKRKAFESVGGFPSINYVGNDGIIQVALSAKYNFICTANNLVYWRQHDGQEIGKGLSDNAYLLNESAINRTLLKKYKALFTADEYKVAKKKQRNYRFGKVLSLLKKGKINTAYLFYKSTFNVPHPVVKRYYHD